MKIYTFKYPVSGGQNSAPIREVAIRRVKGKDMREIDRHSGQPIALTLAMIERLCRLPNGDPLFPGFADELDSEDIEALGELVMPTGDDGPPTGLTH